MRHPGPHASPCGPSGICSGNLSGVIRLDASLTPLQPVLPAPDRMGVKERC